MNNQVAIDFPVRPPPAADVDAMTCDERKVYDALWFGAANARQVAVLADCTGLPKRRVQSIVEILIHKHHVPIGTSMRRPFGNFIIADQEELRQTVQLLRDRGVSNLVRAASLLGMEVRLYLEGIQMEMEMEGSEKS